MENNSNPNSERDQEKIRKEMAELRAELATSLRAFMSDKQLMSKLRPPEIAELKKEFADLDELLRRLETGLIYIAFFGITSSGKSSIINSILGEDIAKVGVEYGVTIEEGHYDQKKPWCLVDVPGIMDNKVNDKIAIEEALRAIGHVFVVDKEPYGPEIELFDLIFEKFKDSPRIVFVNKWDMQLHQPPANVKIVKDRIISKMQKYVKDVEKDIIFGSAALYDGVDKMVRQPLPQLVDRMYNDAGTLGEIINIIDPASRAESLVASVKEKIIALREKIARRINVACAVAAVATSFVPFDTLTVAPALYASQFFSLTLVLGTPVKKEQALKIAYQIIKVCVLVLGAEFLVVAVLETALSFLPIIGTLIDYSALSYFKYKRTMIFGEVSIAYIRNNFSFGNDVEGTIKKARDKAMEQMKFYKKERE